MGYKTYYDILGVEKTATQEEIKKAYRKLSLKFHPDQNKGDSHLEGMFKAINDANDILSNPEKRREYDATLEGRKDYSNNNYSSYSQKTSSSQNTSSSYNQESYEKVDEEIRIELTDYFGKYHKSNKCKIKLHGAKSAPKSSYLSFRKVLWPIVTVMMFFLLFKVLPNNPKVKDFVASNSSQNEWVLTEHADIYSKPDISSRVIGRVPQGNSFDAIRETVYFIQVTFTDAEGELSNGYIRKSCLEYKQGNILTNLINIDELKGLLPPWGWLIVGIVVLYFLLRQYDKYLYKEFSNQLFSKTNIFSMLLSFGAGLFLYYLIDESKTQEIWGYTSSTYVTLFKLLVVVTIVGLYIYNLKKTNWFFALINVLILVAILPIIVGVFLLLIFTKIFSGAEEEDESSTAAGESVSSNTSSSGYSTGGGDISPKWNSGNSIDWEYDRKTLQPKWGNDNSKIWEWDGKTLQPRWSNDNSKIWEWDGKTLQPRWGNDSSKIWEWDGKTLQPRWGNDSSKIWEYDGKTLQPRWGNDSSKIWETKFQIPIPVLAKAVGII